MELCGPHQSPNPQDNDTEPVPHPPGTGAAEDEVRIKTKIRRLYDIANILSSLRLIEKTHLTESRKPAFRWLHVEGGGGGGTCNAAAADQYARWRVQQGDTGTSGPAESGKRHAEGAAEQQQQRRVVSKVSRLDPLAAAPCQAQDTLVRLAGLQL